MTTQKIKINYLTIKNVNLYKKNDYLLKELTHGKEIPWQRLGCNTWLTKSLQKRVIFDLVYRDLLARKKKRLKILDIGSGVHSLQRKIASFHDYTIVDLLAHDDSKIAHKTCKKFSVKLITEDWESAVKKVSRFDIIISVDLFPNVDQRLEKFLSLVKKKAKELRLVLTFYQNNRSYLVKRIGGDEIMTMLSWDGEDCARVLKKTRIIKNKRTLTKIISFKKSIFENGRSIIFIKKILND